MLPMREFGREPAAWLSRCGANDQPAAPHQSIRGPPKFLRHREQPARARPILRATAGRNAPCWGMLGEGQGYCERWPKIVAGFTFLTVQSPARISA